MKLLPRLLAATLLLLPTGCASVLTTWHQKAYTPVVELDDPLIQKAESTRALEQVSDLAAAADELYSQGYVLVGYTKFTHTLAPGFQASYAKMYAERIGAERVVQAEPRQDGGVYAYTVTYWAKGRAFPFGAFTNDVPDETALYFPDSLRAALGETGRPVLVEAVVAGSPAEAAGLEDGELIVAVDGEPIAGTRDLDALVPALANREVTLSVWGLAGLRETRCTFGDALVDADGIGVEGLYYNQPWAFDEYASFQQYSQAMVDAWNSGIQAYQQQQEQARRDAQFAYLSSEVSHLQGRLHELERRPSERGSRLDIAQLRANGDQAWKDFSESMDWD